MISRHGKKRTEVKRKSKRLIQKAPTLEFWGLQKIKDFHICNQLAFFPIGAIGTSPNLERMEIRH